MGLHLRKVGYVRVSSKDQNEERQIKQLKEIRVDIIYQEKISGATLERKELNKILDELKNDDTVFVTDLTRITRSTKDLFLLIESIKSKGATLKSIKDTWLDLSEDNPYSQILITVMAGVNQLERNLIKMRQREGIEIAKPQGKYKGRIKKYHKNHEGIMLLNYIMKKL
ncbi:recombinase family protein [Clostridioides difficile]|uniref:recombinase family protein n=1 Tax=Clostridioides difficile TaxID=1496 RepID=UPI00402AD7A6